MNILNKSANRFVLTLTPYIKSIGRITLFLLTLIHLILPFTPANQHDGIQIIIGAMLIGLVFLGLSIFSFKNVHKACLIGLIFFWIVNTVAAMTGASPLSEGWGVKLIFSISLFLAALIVPKSSLVK